MTIYDNAGKLQCRKMAWMIGVQPLCRSGQGVMFTDINILNLLTSK